jgi:hypothetical protein
MTAARQRTRSSQNRYLMSVAHQLEPDALLGGVLIRLA